MTTWWRDRPPSRRAIEVYPTNFGDTTVKGPRQWPPRPESGLAQRLAETAVPSARNDAVSSATARVNRVTASMP